MEQLPDTYDAVWHICAYLRPRDAIMFGYTCRAIYFVVTSYPMIKNMRDIANMLQRDFVRLSIDGINLNKPLDIPNCLFYMVGVTINIYDKPIDKLYSDDDVCKFRLNPLQIMKKRVRKYTQFAGDIIGFIGRKTLESAGLSLNIPLGEYCFSGIIRTNNLHVSPTNHQKIKYIIYNGHGSELIWIVKIFRV